MNRVSNLNSTSTILTGAATFTGTWEDVSDSRGVVVTLKASHAGTLYLDFSPDGVNADSTLSYAVAAATNEVHRLTVTRQWFRVRYLNGASAQTYFRMEALIGDFQLLTSALNSTIQQDADAIVTRTLGEEMLIAEGKISGYSVVNKFGVNPDIDTGTVPEDVWAVGGLISWPTAAENLTVFSSSAADTAAGTGARTGFAFCLDANYAEVTVPFTLNGTSVVDTGVAVIRCFRMYIDSAGSGGQNAGTITFRQITTTANVFGQISVGLNQSTVTAYTVPASKTAYIRRLAMHLNSSVSSVADGYLMVREFGKLFRVRIAMTASNSFSFEHDIYGGIRVPEKSDIVIRIVAVTASNTSVDSTYDLILVDN